MISSQPENLYRFKIDKDKEIELLKPSKAFTPTGTTDILLKEVRKVLTQPSKILDLGCGIGVSGLALHQLGLVKEPLYGSDIGKDATDAFKLNAKKFNCEAVIKCGSIFEPWEGERFDVIIDDISGISEPVANVSPWFDGVDCHSGLDGTNLIAEVLRSAKKYLNEKGVLFFPVISFSNVEKIIGIAKENFSSVTKLNRVDWPLPKSMYEHKPLFEKLRTDGCIEFQEKFGLILCYTAIYMARND